MSSKENEIELVEFLNGRMTVPGLSNESATSDSSSSAC